ncbi:MAG: diguanylate cyclase [Planctomycetes bacterium]|nr:diguanylate cyclase [Planctomycetota bacterium]
MTGRAYDELRLTGRLPSPPGVAMAIIKLTEAEDYEVADIARVIRSDPALSGRVLKLCNSSAKAGIRAVSSIDEAIQRLGVKTLRSVALGFSLISTYKAGTCATFDFARYWSESLARAIAAQETADLFDYPGAADAYACGLLSGIGRLAFACVHPETYERILANEDSFQPEGLLALEKAEFGIDNRELTAALLADWGIPRHLIVAVTARGRPDLEDEKPAIRELARIMTIAGAIGRVCIQGQDVDSGELRELEEARGIAVMEAEVFTTFCDGVVSAWRDWAGVLELPSSDFASFAELTSESGRRPAEAPAARASDRLRILAVDDNQADLCLLEDALEPTGFELITARHGEEALARALERRPDILVTDLHMRGMDGLSLVRALRRWEEGRQLYILLVTGADDPDAIVAAFEAGADDCVQKPFDPRILRARINAGARIVELQRQLDEDRRHMERQMSEQAVLNRRLEQASLTDPLTGLPNRRAAMNEFSRCWQERDDVDAPVSAIMIDIDHFKRVNDDYGHDTGDEVLKATAATLQRQVGKRGLVARLGGEEFLVILDRKAAEEAGELAESLRRAVAGNEVRHGGFVGHVTISLGVADVFPDEAGYEQLLRAADEAVYAAKRAGRDQVCMAEPATLA